MAKSFNKIAEEHNNILIVDALNLAFRWREQNRYNMPINYENTIKSFASSYKAKHIVVAADHGKSWFRCGMYPEYKGNRALKYAAQTELEQQKFKDFITDYQKCLDYIQQRTEFLFFRFNNTEADDIAAYIVKHYRNKFDHVWLLSTDKDWDLLINDNVSRFSYATRKETRKDNWSEIHKAGYTIEEYLSIKCLKGDGKDNVIGVDDIGDARALSLIRTYGDAMDIACSIPIPGKAKYIENLNKSKEKILLNYELLDLLSYCDKAIGAENTLIIDSIIESRLNSK